MGTTVQDANESVIRYAQRIREIGRRIVSAFKQEERPDDARLNAYRLQLQGILLNCFKKGLNNEIEQRLENNLQNIDDVVKEAIIIENQLKAKETLQRRAAINRKCYSLNFKRNNNVRFLIDSDSEDEINEVRQITKLDYNSRFISSDPVINCSFCNEPHPGKDCKYNPGNASLNQTKCVICLKTDYLGKNCIFNPMCQTNITTTRVETKSNSPKDQIICQWCLKPGHLADKCYLVEKNLRTKDKVIYQFCGLNNHIASSCYKIIGKPNKNNNNTCSYCSRFGHHIDDCRKKIIDEALQQKNGNSLSFGN